MYDQFPYEFIGFGAMYDQFHYDFIGFGTMDDNCPYEFIGFEATSHRSHFGSSHLLLKRSWLAGVPTIGPRGLVLPAWGWGWAARARARARAPHFLD